MKALRASIKALFVKSQSSQRNESISRSEAPDESPFRGEAARDNPRRKGVHDTSGSLSSMSPGRMVITESVDQSDECCSCLSGSTSLLDEIFGVNPCLRSEAIAAINGEIEIETMRFTRLKGTARQALAKAALHDVSNSPAGVQTQMNNASCATMEWVRCILTLRKLHECKMSVHKSSFTPGQYRKITHVVISKSLAHRDSIPLDDCCNEKPDSMLNLLNQFNHAVLTDSSESMQLKFCQDLVDHFEYFTIEAALSPKKSVRRLTRNTKPQHATVASP
jgi:hypothetical protein